MPRRRTVRVGVISLGCPKNLVDTERALGQMAGRGIAIVDDLARADWVLVNTCGFIEEAKRDSIDAILEVAALKAKNPALKIVVAGCLAERYGDALRREIGEVDVVSGLLTRAHVDAIIGEITGTHSAAKLAEYDDRGRLRITPRHVAYLRISEGCDNRCAYCAIPKIRGRLASRPLEAVLADAAELVSDGAVELNVIAQDTTAYGVDLYGKYRLAELLGELRRINPKGWIRLLYAHPAHLKDDVIDELAKGWPLAPYVDLPLQHASDRLLRKMGRHVTRARIDRVIAALRARVPGVYIRTAFIVGFPSETRREFAQLVDFIRAIRFERLGAFAYSREEQTRAARLPGQIPEAEKTRRLDLLMEAQRRIAEEFNASLVGRDLPGIIDAASGRDDYPLEARTYGDAPEVDGTVYAKGRAQAGRLAMLRITGVEGYDLLAEVRP